MSLEEQSPRGGFTGASLCPTFSNQNYPTFSTGNQSLFIEMFIADQFKADE